MNFLATGSEGMLARALVPELRGRGHEVVALSRVELDITNEAAVRARFRALSPDVVVQCAAYTRVDEAERDEETAFLVNAHGALIVARAAEEVGAMVVYPSTDYVFDGRAERPYRPADPVGPRSVYGCSKLAGEIATRRHDRSLVVRTSWLYGAGGGHFVSTITRLARERDRLEVVDDQVGRPTSTRTLAAAIASLSEAGATGVHHVTDGGEPVSWFGLAREALRQQGIETPVTPVSTDRFPRPAPRPAYSVLDCGGAEALLGAPLPDWRVSLADYLAAEVSGR